MKSRENFSCPHISAAIVVKKIGDGEFELIDGQQRLTTIFLIYKYMFEEGGRFFGEPKFSLDYVTMPKMKTLFADNVQIIWYEVDATEDSTAMFTRLNIGKITIRCGISSRTIRRQNIIRESI